MLSTNLWSLFFTVINLILLFILMKVFLFNRINKIIDKRAEIIKKQFSDAENVQKEAYALKQEYEHALSNADEEKNRIIGEARIEAEHEYERIVKDADREAVNLKEKANQDINAEREKSLQSLKTEIAGLVVSAVSKLAASESSFESNKALYDKFLAEMGEENETDIK